MLLEAVEEAAGPDVFGGEDAKAEKDGQQAGAWEGEHDNAQREQGEAEEDSEEALGLLERFDHGPGPGALGCCYRLTCAAANCVNRVLRSEMRSAAPGTN